jgi:hypothetical protein
MNFRSSNLNELIQINPRKKTKYTVQVGRVSAKPKPLAGCSGLVAQQPKQGRRHGFSGWRWPAASGKTATALVGETPDRARQRHGDSI